MQGNTAPAYMGYNVQWWAHFFTVGSTTIFAHDPTSPTPAKLLADFVSELPAGGLPLPPPGWQAAVQCVLQGQAAFAAGTHKTRNPLNPPMRQLWRMGWETAWAQAHNRPYDS